MFTITAKRTALAATLGLAMGILNIAPAQAEGLGAAAQKGQWQARVRGIAIIPTGKSSAVRPSFPTGKVKAKTAVVPELDFSYFFTDNIGAELILATSRHKIKGKGSLSGVGKIGKTWVLPPSLLLQYRFNAHGRARPYVGAGVNYTMYYGDKTSKALKNAIGFTKLTVKNSAGFALQVGMDYDISDRFFVNFDVKSIYMRPKAKLKTPTANGVLVNKTRVHISPMLVGIGVGMRL